MSKVVEFIEDIRAVDSKATTTDITTALSGKANTTHSHAISDVTNLQTALDGKQDTLVSGTNIKTINGVSVLGSGDLEVGGSLGVRLYAGRELITATTTRVVPEGITVLRAYAWGKGGDGTASNSGGGGGCAYGDIAVTAGSTVTFTIASNIAKVTYDGVDMLIANPASGVTAGTASKHASVTNGGAYSGGSGGSTNNGGASSGSPLGTGKNGNGNGGASWAFSPTGKGGAGLGSAGVLPAVTSGVIYEKIGGCGFTTPQLVEPLFTGLHGGVTIPIPASGYDFTNTAGQQGAAGSGGSAGTYTNTKGGNGGFGAGGGAGQTVGGSGGFGGGAGMSYATGYSNSGGLGGGGACASLSSVGGAAAIIIMWG